MKKPTNIIEASPLAKELEAITDFYKKHPFTPKNKALYESKEQEFSKIRQRLITVQSLMTSIENEEQKLKKMYIQLLNELELETEKNLEEYEFILNYKDEAISLKALKEKILKISREKSNLLIANDKLHKAIENYQETLPELKMKPKTTEKVIDCFFDEPENTKTIFKSKTGTDHIIYKWITKNFPEVRTSPPTIYKELCGHKKYDKYFKKNT